jgi:hypothetical protein
LEVHGFRKYNAKTSQALFAAPSDTYDQSAAAWHLKQPAYPQHVLQSILKQDKLHPL